MLSCSMAKDRFNKDLKKMRLNISWGKPSPRSKLELSFNF